MSITYNDFTDPRDGKVYPCVQMPDGKWWFAKNLSYATPNSRTYNDDPSNEPIYGRLYSWDDISNACPSGCHIPSETEWTALTTAIGEYVANTKLKANSVLWHPNTGTDDYGFSVLPAGSYSGEPYRMFLNLNNYAYFWSSSESDASLALDRFFNNLGIYNSADPKSISISLRCIVDEIHTEIDPPTILPAPGTYGAAITCALSSELTGATIYYTVDGTEPTTSSTIYTAPFLVSASTTVKAFATKPGHSDSATTDAVYKLLKWLYNGEGGWTQASAVLIARNGTWERLV